MKSWVQVGEWLVRRQTVVIVGACAFTVTMLSVGGAMALMSEERRGVPPAVAASGNASIPAIVTDDTVLAAQDVSPESVDRLLGEAGSRSAETVEVGEAVYAAAEASAPEGELRTLRGALDETSEVLDGDLPDDASAAQRERRVLDLEEGRASVLDAAAEITEVRRVPSDELPPGATTLAVATPDPAPSVPGRPVFEPTIEPSAPPSTPTPGPTDTPTPEPSGSPSESGGTPSGTPEPEPSEEPTEEPSTEPTPQEPTDEPSSEAPTDGSTTDDAPSGIEELFPSPSATGSPTD